jgi:hypothetical protein
VIDRTLLVRSDQILRFRLKQMTSEVERRGLARPGPGEDELQELLKRLRAAIDGAANERLSRLRQATTGERAALMAQIRSLSSRDLEAASVLGQLYGAIDSDGAPNGSSLGEQRH